MVSPVSPSVSRRSSFNSAKGNRVEIGQKRRNARQTFEKNLQESGLEIEHEYRAVRFFWSYPITFILKRFSRRDSPGGIDY